MQKESLLIKQKHNNQPFREKHYHFHSCLKSSASVKIKRNLIINSLSNSAINFELSFHYFLNYMELNNM